MGMYVSMKKKDNKTVVDHKSNDNLKWITTRILEFGSEISLRTENNRTEQENNKTVKRQNTTRSWSGEPELTEGTWLQLMCCAPPQLHCPKFWGNGVHGVYEGIPDYAGEDGVD